MRVISTAALAALLVCVSGCVVDDDLDLETFGQPIIGGIETDPADYRFVAHIGTPANDGFAACTATLIAPRVMITAAHCVVEAIALGQSSGTATFAVDANIGNQPEDTVDIVDLVAHRYYSPTTIEEYDIALVRLGEDPPAGIEPVAFNTEPIDIAMAGTDVRVVGYGVSDGQQQSGGGIKRQVDLKIDEVRGQLVGLGNDNRNICQGDSGGPTFINFADGPPIIIAVSSFGSNFCMNRSYVTRIDYFYDDFVQEVIEAWSGPCQNDFNCVESGCGRFPDPDCDICGLDGACGGQCEKLDLDCPIGGLAGQVCDSDFACEYRHCVTAPDDDRVKFCSESCDPGGDALAQCTPPLGACTATPEGSACTFEGPSVSAQGATCDEAGDCRSSLCDLKHGICVEPCNSGADCGDPYSCVSLSGTKVCTVDEGGCCTVAPGARPGYSVGSGAGLMFLAFLALMRIRRRARMSVK